MLDIQLTEGTNMALTFVLSVTASRLLHIQTPSWLWWHVSCCCCCRRDFLLLEHLPVTVTQSSSDYTAVCCSSPSSDMQSQVVMLCVSRTVSQDSGYFSFKFVETSFLTEVELELGCTSVQNLFIPQGGVESPSSFIHLSNSRTEGEGVGGWGVGWRLSQLSQVRRHSHTMVSLESAVNLKPRI